ncbi:MAG: hypothetical protein HDR15_05020 [Lachnospiraceae bacterium]|nr:hypothetical protein [Lachnospiraceae bacterium]
MESDTIEVEWLEETEPEEGVAGITEAECLDVTGRSDAVGQFGAAGQKEGSKQPEFAQVREGGRTYLLCDCGDVCDDEEAMLADNRPEGLLPVAKRSMNGQIQLSYDITGKQSLAGCYGKKAIAFEALCAMLLSVHSCLNRMEEYLLSEDCLVLCPAYLYTNMGGRQLYFVYLPAPGGAFSERIRELAQFLMEHADYEDERAVALAGQFYQYTEAENFSMTVFLEENNVYFEEPDTGKEQDEQADDMPVEEGQLPQESGYPAETEERQENGKRWRLLGPAAAAMIGFAAWQAWQVPWNAQARIPAGICAGIAAGIGLRYIGWAKRTLAKKEREIFFMDGFSSKDE